jgi:hypothetical protein
MMGSAIKGKLLFMEMPDGECMKIIVILKGMRVRQ